MKSMSKFFLLTVLFIFSAGFFWAVLAEEKDSFLEPKLNRAEAIPGEYIVVFKENNLWRRLTGVPIPNVEEIAQSYALTPSFAYSAVFKGFSAKISEDTLEELKKDKRVLMISPNYKVQAFAFQPAEVVPTGIRRVRADQSTLKGKGVEVAVIDSGISVNHPEFNGKILGGTNCVAPASFNDGGGHGTHVAGTVAALDNDIGVVGVAPEAKLWAVKVLSDSGSGSWQSVICGIDFVTSKAPANGGNIKVANMSLGGGGQSDNNCGLSNSDAMHLAICRSRDAGVTYVVAAGNSANDARFHVPAGYDDAVITVSALADTDGLPGSQGLVTKWGSDDSFALFSNFGLVVDLAAPGTNILSTWLNDGYKSIDGTSMAAPHVAGAAALYIEAHPNAQFKEVRDALIAAGEKVGQGHKNTFKRNPEPLVQISF